MKKIITLMAACFGFALLAGTDIEINGKFAGSKVGDKVPKAWQFNQNIKPRGTGSVVQCGKELGVKIVCPDKDVHYYTREFIPVKPGETYEISCDAVGTGKAGVGFYIYDAKKQWICGQYCPVVALKNGKNELKFKYTFPKEFWKKVPTFIQVDFFATGKAEVTFTDVELEKK